MDSLLAKAANQAPSPQATPPTPPGSTNGGEGKVDEGGEEEGFLEQHQEALIITVVGAALVGAWYMLRRR